MKLSPSTPTKIQKYKALNSRHDAVCTDGWIYAKNHQLNPCVLVIIIMFVYIYTTDAAAAAAPATQAQVQNMAFNYGGPGQCYVHVRCTLRMVQRVLHFSFSLLPCLSCRVPHYFFSFVRALVIRLNLPEA